MILNVQSGRGWRDSYPFDWGEGDRWMIVTGEGSSPQFVDVIPWGRLGQYALDVEGVGAVVDCMFTQRAVRRLSDAPVDPALIKFLVAAAGRAGSGGNRQPWRFVAVVDEATRARLGEWYREGWQEYQDRGMASLPVTATAGQQRSVDDAEHLADHLQDAPVVIVACFLTSPHQPVDIFAGASVFPAVQNLLLAARAVGLGATLTTMQALSGIDARGQAVGSPDLLGRLRTMLDIPADVVPVAVIPIGWPCEPYRAGRRKASHRLLMLDRWTRHRPTSGDEAGR